MESLGEYVIATIERRQLIMEKDTVEWFSPSFNNPKD
jgi:hypothetical protein